MTKKDYVKLAEIVRKHRLHVSTICSDDLSDTLVTELVADLADMLRKDNPRFDLARFVEACEPRATRAA